MSPTPAYWFTVFNEETWKQFSVLQDKVAAFPISREKAAHRLKPADILLCYVSGWSRFVGIGSATGTCRTARRPVFGGFPLEVPAKVSIQLALEFGVPIHGLLERLSFNQQNPNGWRYYVRQSPNQWPDVDAELIINELNRATAHPVRRARPAGVKRIPA